MWQSVIPIEFKRVRQGHADIEVILKWLDGPDKQVAKAWPPKNNSYIYYNSVIMGMHVRLYTCINIRTRAQMMLLTEMFTWILRSSGIPPTVPLLVVCIT